MERRLARGRAFRPQLKREALGAPDHSEELAMATKIAKIVFGFLGLLFVVVALLPALRDEPIDTRTLTTAVVLLLLALVLRPRRPSGPPPEPGA